MLPGFVAFPDEFAARYRDRGYWRDITLAQHFNALCERYAERVALSDGERDITYRELDEVATRLALNLLDLGLRQGDRIVVQLPNVVEFVFMHLALQKIGAMPILALPAHRFLELNQFVEISGAVACVTVDRAKDCDFRELFERIRRSHTDFRSHIVLGDPGAGGVSLQGLLTRQPTAQHKDLEAIAPDPAQPALFLLSGGTTGVPKLIPRTHNDYIYNSEMAASVCAITAQSVLLLVLPIAHNLPLACPGLQGFMLHGAKVVLSTNTHPSSVFALVDQEHVTHIHLVPALLIRWLAAPELGEFDLSSLKVLQSGGQRLQPETRSLAEKLIPSAQVQENFGMAEGVLMFVRLDDPPEVRAQTVGRTICPDDEVVILDDDGNAVAFGDVGEFCCRGPYTLRGYFNAEQYNKRAFTADGFYRSGDLMRQHSSGNFIVEGRKKDLINRGGEKISAEEIENLILGHPSVENVACVAVPDPDLGERMCACVILRNGQSLSLAALAEFLLGYEIAKIKLPERLLLVRDFPLSNFGKVSKKTLVELASEALAGGLKEVQLHKEQAA
jgi:2,3-dihydroxybenzoate-AMP ligase